MDIIPHSFYSLITKELPSTNIPETLTREYLDRFGTTGSSKKPIVLLKLADDLMIRYGKTFIFSNAKNTFVMQNSLVDTDIYILKEGIAKHIGKVMKNEVGLYINPNFMTNSLCHSYANIRLQIEERKNTNILKISYYGDVYSYYHIMDNKLVLTPINDLKETSFFLTYISSHLKDIQDKIAELSDDQLIYLEFLLQNHDIGTPYNYHEFLRNFIYGIIYNLDQSKIIDIMKFMKFPHVKTIYDFFVNEKWEVVDYLVDLKDFSVFDRKSIINAIIYNGNILKNIKIGTLLKLYNWRSAEFTDRICTELTKNGLSTYCNTIRTVPYKPSPLRREISKF